MVTSVEDSISETIPADFLTPIVSISELFIEMNL